MHTNQKQHKERLISPVVARLQIGGAHRLGDVAGRAKVDDLHTVRLPAWIHQHNVLRFEVSVNQTKALELAERCAHLLQHGADHLQRQWAELILLQEVIQVLLKHLEHQARVVTVLKALEGAHQVVLVCVLTAQACQDAHLDLTLARVRRMLLQDFHRHNLVGAALPALHDLAEGPAAQELQHLIRVLHRAEDLVLQQLVVAVIGPTPCASHVLIGGHRAAHVALQHGRQRRMFLYDLHGPCATDLLLVFFAFKPTSVKRPFALLHLVLSLFLLCFQSSSSHTAVGRKNPSVRLSGSHSL